MVCDRAIAGQWRFSLSSKVIAPDSTHGASARRLAAALLAFWGTWLAVVTASNVTNALTAAGLVRRPAFASSNFELVESTTAIYHLPRAGVWLLFLGVIAWEALAATLYLRAAWRAGRGVAATAAATTAALVGMTLFAAFMLADEICIAYSLQAGHMRAFAAQGVTWLVARAALRDESGVPKCSAPECGAPERGAPERG